MRALRISVHISFSKDVIAVADRALPTPGGGGLGNMSKRGRAVSMLAGAGEVKEFSSADAGNAICRGEGE